MTAYINSKHRLIVVWPNGRRERTKVIIAPPNTHKANRIAQAFRRALVLVQTLLGALSLSAMAALLIICIVAAYS